MLKNCFTKTSSCLLFVLLTVSFFVRLFYLHTPSSYVFDEVYHLPAVRVLFQNQPVEPSSTHDWLHPPLAKLIQAASINLIGDNSFAWRFPSAIFGTISIAALYYLALTIFKNSRLALLAATFFSFDGLQLTMSRITMNDIFVTTWIIFALAFFYRFFTLHRPKQLILAGIFTGLALATKHSALLLYPIFLLFLVFKKSNYLKHPKKLLFTIYCLLITPLLIYLLSYVPYFLHGNSLTDFFRLHQQIFRYQTTLSATHTYQSPAWQWPFLIRPVWFYVKYQTNTISNIYNLGNPAIFWGGLVAVIYLIINKSIRYSLLAIRYLLITYSFLFLPWLLSPRIMFLHHYLPALPLLCLILAKVLFDLKNKLLITSFLLLVTSIFIFFYPLNTAIPLPSNILKYWFWLPTWK